MRGKRPIFTQGGRGGGADGGRGVGGVVDGGRGGGGGDGGQLSTNLSK